MSPRCPDRDSPTDPTRPDGIRGKEAVDLGVRHQVRESSEAALGLQRLCGAREAGPRRQCQRAADADASHAERRDSPTRRPMSRTTRRLSGFGATAATSASISAGSVDPARRARLPPPPRTPADVGRSRGRDPDGPRGSTRLLRSAARLHLTDQSPVARHGRARPRAAGRREVRTDHQWRPRSTVR